MDRAVERGRGIADGMAGREDERPPNCIVQGPAPGAPHPPALQRRENLAVASGERDVANSSRGVHPRLDGRTTSTLAPYACHAHTLPCTICYPLRRRKNDLALLLGAFQAPPCSKGWPPCDTWTWATSVIESRTFVPSSSVGEGGGDGL